MRIFWMRRYFARAWFRCLLVAALIIGGGICGAWISKLVIVSSDRADMRRYTDQVLDRAVDVFAEVDDMLAVINGSPFPFCSTEEISYLRDILFRTKFLKDLGRVKDGAFHCSAVFGKGRKPMPLITHDFETLDGKLIYTKARLAISNTTAPIIGTGHANVVLDPQAFETLKNPDYTFSVMFNPVGMPETIGLFGTLNQGAIGRVRPSGGGRQGGTIFRNVCRKTACVTVNVEVGRLEASAQPMTIILTLFGAALGGALGVILILLRRNTMSMKARLQQAIARKRLTVEYQPIVDIVTGKPVAAEALARWRDNGEAISPDVFISVAEKSGLINRLTTCIIEHVLDDMAAFLVANRNFHININISAADLFDRQFNDWLAARLKAANVASDQILLEITEQSTANSSDAIAAIRRLRARGHKIFIDDFGTGYSSLAYLGELSVDGIKIDRSFTRTIGTGSVSVSIIPQIIGMAHVHHLAIVVEGIETEAQRDYFAALVPKVDGQGWLFGRPTTSAAIREMLHASREQSNATSDI
ncbi:EAL domain-containing protein [Phyllobacterium sp. BT25]|uniref:cyclic-guanylate-specific phosphodiesterase n=1 Tax=Phyllobacterium pellucidum TaxID=2740464 RepID=A0A849VR26_9HYPH|nr:EAL domain-containing protein [Phyllobacterium pellucidum]NTS32402.1 EAL domain-containing protein [Phyllobacterium pellucidum]